MKFNALILKYNGKELQETGMYSYGWRDYMPDLGRWNGIDQLAESYLSTSPFAYVANNPVSSFDVDGRWFNEDGSIGQSPPTWGLHGSQYQPMKTFSSNDGMHTNEGAGVTDNGNNGNNRIAQGPKPNIFKTIGNFVKKIFGKSKRAVAGVLTVGAATFEGFGSEVEVVGSNMLRLGAIFRLGQWGLSLMLNGDSSHASGYDIPLTGATDIPVTTTADEPADESGNLYLYRNMRNVNGMPMVGEGLDKLGLRDRDVNLLSNSTMITPLFANGLSVTVGYGDVIPPNVPDFSRGKGTIFRIPASSLMSYGLVGLPVLNPDVPNYGQVRPAIPMNVGTFRALIQSTAPAWQPVK